MKLYIVRHGETIENRSNIIQGQQHGQLSDLGILQREKLARRLQDFSFDAIYSSDLERTRETLAPFTSTTPLPVRYTEVLREKSFGDLEGHSGEIYRRKLQASGKTRIDFRPNKGESFIDLTDRLTPFVEALHANHSGESILLMTHGGVVRVLLNLLLGVPLEELLQTEIRNTSISTVCFHPHTRDEKGVQSFSMNDYTHLSELDDSGEHTNGVDAFFGALPVKD
jgi:broad specificity phosphatase PhoE